MRIIRFALALLPLLFAVPLNAIIMRHDREPARYAALGANYLAVGMIGDKVTCTLIAPRWALSAAHTVEDYFNPAGKPFVTFAGKRYEVDKIILHPKRVRGAVDSDSDVVLLRLREPVQDIAPVLLYERGDEPDKVVTIVGYGETGNGLTRERNPRGKVFAANNKVEAVFEHSIVITFDAPPAGLDLEGLPGAGDSGCPALLEENGKLYTVGVGSFNSGSDATSSGYGTIDGFARVSAHRKWITDTMAADPPSTIPMFGAYVRNPSLPQTPAGSVAKSLIAAFNSGSVDRIAAFNRAHGRRRPDEEIQKAAAGWQPLFDEYGAYEIRGYKEAGPYTIAVFVRAAKGDLGRAVAVELERDGEHRVKRMVMADVEEPAQ
jgi:hypothetical protein